MINIFILLILFSFSSQAMIQSSINVEVHENIQDPSELNNIIIEKTEYPHIIVWYGGESGVNKEGAQFYKDHIFSEFNKQDKPFKFYLYDLIAWGGLRNLRASVKTKDKLAENIKTSRYSFIHSADFFNDLIQEKNPEIIQYYNETILKNPVLSYPSTGRKPNHIMVKDVLSAESLKTIHDIDTAYAYSPLQYLEGIYLAKTIINSSNTKQNIIFMLPNDEYKYYTSPSLQEDLNKIIKRDSNIIFVNFKYGDEIYKRPYISKAKKVNKLEIESYLE